jgi:hypothetical protein
MSRWVAAWRSRLDGEVHGDPAVSTEASAASWKRPRRELSGARPVSLSCGLQIELAADYRFDPIVS